MLPSWLDTLLSAQPRRFTLIGAALAAAVVFSLWRAALPLSGDAHVVAQLQQRLHRQISADFEHLRFGGISEEAVEQAYCGRLPSASLRFQVVGGRAYVAGETRPWETRHQNFKRQLLRLWLAGRLPEGLDFVLDSEDDASSPLYHNVTCGARGLVLGAARLARTPRDRTPVALVPDWSFAGWLEAGTLPWEEMAPMLRRAGSELAWSERLPVLFFRGAPTGARRNLDTALMDQHADQADVKLVDWKAAGGFETLPAHCRRRYLLHLPGNSYSARLKYLLACGSTVVISQNPWLEFWYGLLQRGQHFVEAVAVDPDNRGGQLLDAVALLRRHDDVARGIAERGQALVLQVLTQETIDAYWAKVLSTYRRLQQFAPRAPHADAVLLEESVIVPRIVDYRERTCGLCRWQPDPQPPA